jgi:cellulose synthase/poly-beta-1,6-N-acetylglucosamine synthase-like glycosyltransferase
MNMPSGTGTSVRTAFISVVIPTRNRAELLARALASIQAQTYQDFEVIVIDDGSDEATKAAYRQIWQTLDQRFFLHFPSERSVRPLGPSATRNFGISLATGEIVTFCDDDDFWTAPQHLENVAKAFSSCRDLDVYFGNQTGVSEQGTQICDWFPDLRRAVSKNATSRAAPISVSVEMLCAARGFAHLNILAVRLALVREAGGFWERVSYEEDRDFFWRVIDRSRRIYFNPEIVAQHNIPDPTKTQNQSTQHLQAERWLLAILVCQHIGTTVKNRGIAKLARKYEGDLLRHLALHFAGTGRNGLALSFACKALGARFSFKWCAYSSLIAFRALFMEKAL